MSVTQWPDTPFGDEAAMADFLMANDMAHNAIAAALIVQGKIVTSLPLADMGNVNDWLMAHQLIHRQEFDALGLTGDIELSTVDFEDEQAYYDWMQMHALIHGYVESALGL